MFDKHRKRRVIYNDDGDQVLCGYDGYPYQVVDAQSFLDTRTTPTFGTHVDTYVLCVGNGADPPYGAMLGGKVWPCLGTADRGTQLIIEACHEKGMEVWGSLRINDIHDSFMADRLEETAEPIKAEHPEYLIAPEADRQLPGEITERYLWTALNFALPEVRDYRLKFIEKNASAHDFDGYELDFTRFIWDFPLGEERKHAHLMTDFVRKVRELLDTIGKQRGRPYTLVVHVPDSPQAALDLGLDVEAWLEEELVDVLVVGMGYVVYDMKLDQWREMGACYGLPVYPSLNINTFGKTWTDLLGRHVYQEAARAISAYWWQEGIEGFYLFNLFCLEDKNVAALPREYIYAHLQEVGDPAAMERKDKLYAIQTTSDRGFCQQGSAATPLPIALDTVEYELPLFIGPDADDPQAKMTVRALTSGGDADTKVWFRLNHTLLEPRKEGDWYSAEVPKGIMRSGYNKLAIWSNVELTETERPVIVQRVFVPVSYG